MHPALMTAIAASQRQDKLNRAAEARRAEQARPARHGARREPGSRQPARHHHLGLRHLAAPRAK
jgi:hypothetical protein